MSDQVSRGGGGEEELDSLPDNHQWCESDIGGETEQTFIWRIKRYSERTQEEGEFLESSQYTMEDANNQPTFWKLRFYPKGFGTGTTDDWVSMCLVNETGHLIRVRCEVSILGDGSKLVGKVYKYPVTEVNPISAFKLVSTETLTSQAFTYLPDDTLTVAWRVIIPGKELTLSSSKVSPSPGEYKQRMYEDLCIYMMNAYQEDDSLSDCKIVCQGEEFSCHMFVLAARSPVFHAMFTSDHVEARERRVNIENMEPRVVKELLHFIYTGNVPDMSEDGSAEDLLAAAEQYQLEVLKEMCQDSICNNMSTENVVEHLIMGDLCRAKRLKKSAISFIVNRMKSVVKTDGWKKLYNHPELMTEVCVADKGGDGDEEECQGDYEERKAKRIRT